MPPPDLAWLHLVSTSHPQAGGVGDRRDVHRGVGFVPTYCPFVHCLFPGFSTRFGQFLHSYLWILWIAAG